MSRNVEELFFWNSPPCKSGDPYPNNLYQVQALASGAAAASIDWTAALPAEALKNEFFITLESLTTDCYVRFGPTSTTATTANNGRLIKAGSPGVAFYVSPKRHKFIDFIAPSGAGVLKVQLSSPPGARLDQ